MENEMTVGPVATIGDEETISFLQSTFCVDDMLVSVLCFPGSYTYKVL